VLSLKDNIGAEVKESVNKFKKQMCKASGDNYDY
jgi:hypothetical protein